MKIVCAWCGRDMGEKEPYEDKGVTHSVCPSCSATQFGVDPIPVSGSNKPCPECGRTTHRYTSRESGKIFNRCLVCQHSWTEPIEDLLKEAMMKYAPQLAEDYKEFVRRQFKAMRDDLGANLPGVYSSHRWSHTFYALRSNLDQTFPDGVPTYRADHSVYSVSDSKLEKNAKEYGERVALEWYGKMQSKLGALDNVTVSEPARGGIVTIEGHHDSNVVKVLQHPIINVSSRGLLFHQFPARIYVNDKFMSEPQYKKTIQGWGVPEIEREQKPKRQPIDPNTRPKSYTFRFAATMIAAVRTDIRQDSAKGMTEEEAWNKLYKREMKGGYYSKVCDPVVTAIHAWNGRLLWRASSGLPKPGPIIDVDASVLLSRRPSRPRVAGYRRSAPWSVRNIMGEIHG